MNQINSELEFEKLIKELPDRELLEFVARQNYETCSQIATQDNRLKDLESGNKKASSISGGITGAIAGIVMGIIGYFAK